MVLAAPGNRDVLSGSRNRLRLGVIGFGYWGPNLARNISERTDMELIGIADTSASRLAVARQAYPWVRLSESAADLLRAPDIDAIVIATPPEAHCELAVEALERGKHVLVEKPLATSSADSLRMIEAAERCGRTLLVDHTFLFTPAVRRIKQYIDNGDLGDIYYFDSTRINLGLFQTNSNVVWDLGPHDVAILLHLLGQQARTVSAIGASHLDAGLENIAYLSLKFDSGVLAHLHLNWLAPVKIRKTIIGGSKKMIVYDDMEPSDKLKLFDSGADRVVTKEDAYRAYVEYRTGDILIPRLEKTEALASECGHFVQVASGSAASISDGRLGLEVVRVLEAAQQSIRLNGCPIEVEQ